jgi:hypothetical protein
MNTTIDVYDADLQPVTSGDPIDPDLGLKLKIYGDDEQMATVLLAREPDGSYTLTIYRDADLPIKIQTVDYFDGSRDNLTGRDPGYYTVLRDR